MHFSLFIFLITFGAIAQAQLSDSQLSCLLEPSSEIKLSSQVSGIVSQVNTERGKVVKKGQVLISLESDLERAVLKTFKAKAEFAARKLERNQELFDMELLSDFERDELVTEQQLANLTLEEAESRLRKRDIISPINGVVVKRHVSIGEYVGSEPVLELVALSPLHAEVVMQTSQYGFVKEGMQIEISIANPLNTASETLYHGEITVVDRVIDAASGTFGFRVKVDNPGLKLPAGVKCRVGGLTP